MTQKRSDKNKIKGNRPKRRKTMLTIFWLVIMVPIISFALLILSVKNGQFGDLPTFEELESPNSSVASELYSDNDELMGTYFVQNRRFVDYEDLSPYLVQSLVATEDIRFTEHSGIDFESLMRVGVKTILLGRKEGGGSTISQQLAKNLYPRDTTRVTSSIKKVSRLVISKLKEWITAVMLEKNYSKQEIISMYFNIVEYGSNSFGINSAAQTFFGKTADNLTYEEAAMLVGVVNAPTRYSPIRNPNNALRRRNLVLKRTAESGFIPANQIDSIMRIPINLNYKVTSHNDGTSTYFRSMVSKYMMASKPVRSSYYSNWDYEKSLELWNGDPLYGWCNKNLKSDSTKYNIYRDGLKIYSTVNPTLQRYAEEAVSTHMKGEVQPLFNNQIKNKGTIFSDLEGEEEELIMQRAIRNTDRYRVMKRANYDDKSIMRNFMTPVKMRVFSYSKDKGVDTLMSPWDSIRYHKSILRASFVAIDPSTSHVKAYVGGTDFRFFKYDMATQGRRQVGSTIKPFIYTFAVDYLGIDPCTPVANLPVSVDGWSPKDDGVIYSGESHPLWWGLAKSRNNYTTWIIKQSNYKAVSDLIYKLGVSSYIDPVPAMCLGSSDISLYEMVSAYTTFANNGVHAKPMFITKIEDRYGNIIATFNSSSNDAISSKSAYTILSMMRKVTEPGGTGVRLRWKYGIYNEVAGKTGTTNNASDCWFIGVTPKLVAGAWVGGEDRSIHLDGNVQGATLALPIFGEFMQRVYSDKSTGISKKDVFLMPQGASKITCPADIKIDNDADDRESVEHSFFD